MFQKPVERSPNSLPRLSWICTRQDSMRPNKKLWGKNSYGACAEQLSGRHSNSWQLERGDLNDDYYMHLVEISERPCLSIQIRSDQISRLVVSDSLRPHESQHARPPCPSPTPGVHSDSHPSSQWYHPAISSSVVPFSFCPNPSQHQSLFQWVNSSH